MERLRPGDTVCEVRLDRLGRRMMKLIQLIEDFSQRRVNFVSLENNLDTTTPMGMLLFSICAAFAEMERALIRELVLAGLSTAQAQGCRGGRPKSLTPEKQATLNALRQTGQFSVSQICATVGITRSVYYRFVNFCDSSSHFTGVDTRYVSGYDLNRF